MKKTLHLLFGMALMLAPTATSAQTLLDEGFEMGSSQADAKLPEGWTTVNGYQGDKADYNWYNYYHDATNGTPTITGNNCMAVDGPTYESSPYGGFGPREEVLLTPELDLNDTYQLTFTWRVSPMNHHENSKYDLQVRIVEDGNLAGAETVFSIQNQQMLKESGVLEFPIDAWTAHISKIDLSDWKGQKIKVAFVYKMYKEIANIAWLDDVSVKQFKPASTPEASLSLDRITFGTVYVGERFYSDVIRMTNTGLKGLKITGTDFPAGIDINIDTEAVDLDKNEHVDFQLSYTAAMTTPATGNAVLHTTGGDVTIAYSATKKAVPAGYTLETFNDYFPPAGWKNNGWSRSNIAIEGDWSAYNSGGFSDATLVSPRLDLTNGGQVTFTFYDQYDGEYAPEIDQRFEVSYDGGKTWKTLWTRDYQTEVNELITKTIDLGKGTDDSYVRWIYPEVTTDDEGYAVDHSNFTLDRVLLPNLYGADGLPTVATLISPKDETVNIYPKEIKLEWGPAQFAHGYKVFVGSNAEVNNLVDGVDVGKALTYTIAVADYETTYSWKIVPYNTLGDNRDVPVWSFTTQKDASTASFPYVEDFASKDLPTGWVAPAPGTYNRNWYVNTYSPYENGEVKSNALTSSYMAVNGEENYIVTPDFKLPADKTMAISFVWGDEHPRDLVVDPTGMVKKQNVEPNNGVSEGIFSIYADGQYTVLSTISENSFDGDRKYWIPETFDLSAYAGKTVSFRWTHKCYSSGGDGGTSVAHVVIEEVLGDKATFNKARWTAGKVNYEKGVNSGNQFTMFNKGVNTLKVKSATFETPNFETSLKAGDEITPGEGMQFSLQFNALETAAAVSDQLTVEFESGYKVTFPVAGEALGKNVAYYSFEPNPLELDWTKDFTMIDADNAVSYAFGAYWLHFDKSGEKFAFAVGDDDMETGLYGIMGPVSGTHALVAASPAEATGQSADNWIIYQQQQATNSSKFDFYARNWESAESVLPSPAHHVSVLVSTKGNTKTSDFEVVMKDTEMPFLSGKAWNHYEVDLSKYAGQNIYVAVRHTTNGASNVCFFDDFTFTDLQPAGDGIEAVKAIGNEAEVEVYTLGGVLAKSGRGQETLQSLNKGVYVVKVKEGDSIRTLRVAKK